MSFEKLNLIQPIAKALAEEGYTKPTPIQEQAIPVILDRRDLFGIAQTGTGKTAAFAIPVLQLLTEEAGRETGRRTIKVLICTPTRELAIQIGESFAAYGKHLRLRHTVIFGGVTQKAQTDALHAGIDILIATPGRLLDLMKPAVHLPPAHQVVRARRGRPDARHGIIHDIKRSSPSCRPSGSRCSSRPPCPPKSSSWPAPSSPTPPRWKVTPASSTVDKIRQAVYFVDKTNKKNLLNHLLADKAIVSALVFTRTKHGADRVVKDLAKAGILAQAIHGNKSQNARQGPSAISRTAKPACWWLLTLRPRASTSTS
jgi:ATP-dependent RNA helicase RhlE